MTNPLILRLNSYAKLSQADRALVDRVAGRTTRDVQPRRDVVREGDKPRAVHLVLEGWACRYKQLPDGRRQVVSFFIPGDLCDTNVFILREMDHSVAAVSRLRVAEIAPTDFESMIQESARIAQALWWNELVNAATSREWTTNIGQRTAYERLSHLLLEMFTRQEAVGLTRDHSCPFPLTQVDLADACGLTAVHVNRTLQELRRDKLIELHGRMLTLLDRRALTEVAMFNPNYLHLEREGRHLDAND